MGKNQSTDKNAHSNFRKGMSDYHDGENVTDQLGNDDYHRCGTNLKDPNSVDFDGSEAQGNELSEEDEESELNEFHGKENRDEQEETQRP
jgi:hypothetical protein